MSNPSKSKLKAIACLNAFTFTGLQIFLVTLFPFISEKLGISISSVVGCFSVGSFLFLWASPYWASKSDILGRRKIFIIGFLGLFFSFALLVVLLNFSSVFTTKGTVAVLLLSRIIYGLTASSIVPVSQALQSDLSQADRQMKAMLRHSLSLSAGRGVGLSLLLLGGDQINFILCSCLIWILLSILVNAFAGQSELKRTPPSAPSQWSDQLSRIKWVFALGILFTCYIEVLNSSLASTLKISFSLKSLESGRLMAKVLMASNFIIILTQLLSKARSSTFWKTGLTLGIVFLFIGSTLLAWMKSELHLWGAIAFLSLSMGLVPPSYLTALSLLNQSSGQQGKKAGLIGSAHTLGYAVGGVLTSIILKVGHLSIYSLMMSIVFLIMITAFHLFNSPAIKTLIQGTTEKEGLPQC